MTEHTVNVPALRKALEHITAHPEEWDQSDWAKITPCGTTYCLAGTVVVQAGYSINFFAPSAFSDLLSDGEIVSTNLTTDGQRISTLAKDLLGLCQDRAARLFDGLNSLHDLWRLASELTHGEIEVPIELRT